MPKSMLETWPILGTDVSACLQKGFLLKIYLIQSLEISVNYLLKQVTLSKKEKFFKSHFLGEREGLKKWPLGLNRSISVRCSLVFCCGKERTPLSRRACQAC
jgi:hypothetical protein